jgi:glycolate oxidase
MPKMFSESDLTTMFGLRQAFDPSGLCNPYKVLPSPRLCGERPARRPGGAQIPAEDAAQVF